MTFDAGSEDKDELRTLNQEVTENRLRNLKLEILTSTDVEKNNSNLLVDFLTDQDGFANSITVSDGLFISRNNQFNQHYVFSVDSNFATAQKSFSTGVSGKASAYDQENEHVAVVTSSSGDSPNSGENGTFNASYEVFDSNGSLVSSGTVSRSAFELQGELDTEAYYVGPNELRILGLCNDNIDSNDFDDRTMVVASVDTSSGTQTGNDERFARGDNLNVLAVSYDTNGVGEIYVEGDEDVIVVSGTVSFDSSIFNGFFGFDESIVGVSDDQCFIYRFGDSFNDIFQILNDGSISNQEINSSDGGDTDDDRGFLGDRYLLRNAGFPDYGGVDVAGPFLVQRSSSNISGITDSGSANEVAYDGQNDILRADNNYIFTNNDVASGGQNVGDNISSNADDRPVSTGGDMWETSGIDPVTVDIVKGQTSVQFSSDFEFNSGPIESSQQIDFIRVEFETNTQQTIDQFTLVDETDGTEVAVIPTEEKVDVSQYNLTDVSLRIKQKNYIDDGGVTEVSALTF